MTKKQWKIAGGITLGIAILYYFFVYNKKPKPVTGIISEAPVTDATIDPNAVDQNGQPLA